MTTTTSGNRPPTTAPSRAPRAARVGTATVYRWEVAKLAALLRTRLLLLGCLVAPPLIVLVLRGQTPPADTLYGRYIHDSGLAVPLLLLGFATQWVFPLLTSLVAGDVFASEDHHGTWKTLLTRSASRSQLFWAKALAATTSAVLALVVLSASTIASSLLLVGQQPLTGLSGQVIDPGTALRLVVAAWALALPPLVGFTALALLLSVLTRNPAIGVVGPVVLGLAMGLLGSVGALAGVRQVLLTTPLESWHGLFAAHPFHGPLETGLVTSAVWTAVCLVIAHTALRRRDITGG